MGKEVPTPEKILKVMRRHTGQWLTTEAIAARIGIQRGSTSRNLGLLEKDKTNNVERRPSLEFENAIEWRAIA